MIEEPLYVKDAPKITDTLKIHKVVREKYIKMRYQLLTLTIYQQIMNHSIAPFHCEYYRKPEDRILCGHESHQCNMKTNVLSAGSIMMILLIKNGCNVHHVPSGSMNLAFR